MDGGLPQQRQGDIGIADGGTQIHELAQTPANLFGWTRREQPTECPQTLSKAPDGNAQVVNRFGIVEALSGALLFRQEPPQPRSGLVAGVSGNVLRLHRFYFLPRTTSGRP
jgi:hypothetical protein